MAKSRTWVKEAEEKEGKMKALCKKRNICMFLYALGLCIIFACFIAEVTLEAPIFFLPILTICCIGLIWTPYYLEMLRECHQTITDYILYTNGCAWNPKK